MGRCCDLCISAWLGMALLWVWLDCYFRVRTA